MEFFEWLSVPQFIFTYVQKGYIYMHQLYICLGIAGGMYLLCLIFGGLGMYTMAKKQNMKYSFLAFLPFANTYYAGKLAGEANFFGQKMKRTGLYAMITEFAYFVLEGLFLFCQIMLNIYECFVEITENGVKNTYIDISKAPQSLQWIETGANWFYYLSTLLSVVQLVFFFVLFIAMFRKYYAKSPFLMAFLSAFLPFRGFVLFAVRNNDPVDYNAYLRSRAEEIMRQQRQAGYGGYPGGYGGNYGGYNGGNNQGGYGGSSGSSDPFSDFGSSGNGGGNSAPSDDDPFSEFSHGGNRGSGDGDGESGE